MGRDMKPKQSKLAVKLCQWACLSLVIAGANVLLSHRSSFAAEAVSSDDTVSLAGTSAGESSDKSETVETLAQKVKSLALRQYETPSRSKNSVSSSATSSANNAARAKAEAKRKAAEEIANQLKADVVDLTQTLKTQTGLLSQAQGEAKIKTQNEDAYRRQFAPVFKSMDEAQTAAKNATEKLNSSKALAQKYADAKSAAEKLLVKLAEELAVAQKDLGKKKEALAVAQKKLKEATSTRVNLKARENELKEAETAVRSAEARISEINAKSQKANMERQAAWLAKVAVDIKVVMDQKVANLAVGELAKREKAHAAHLATMKGLSAQRQTAEAKVAMLTKLNTDLSARLAEKTAASADAQKKLASAVNELNQLAKVKSPPMTESERLRAEQKATLKQLLAMGVSNKVPSIPDSELEGYYKAAVWASTEVPERRLWTEVALAEIRLQRRELFKARDVEEFCPGFGSASERSKNICWLRIIGALVKFESNWKTTTTFVEPDTGKASIGLMALSPGECPNAQTAARLKIGILNLSCGIDRMASLVSSDGYIDGPKGNRGAAAYWSVLREPYRFGKYRLGKQKEIKVLTRKYRSF